MIVTSVLIGDVPPWLLPDPVVNLTLADIRKDWSDVSDVGKLVEVLCFFSPFFTDGSNNPDSGHTGAGVYIPEFDVQICRRLTDGLSVYSVEVFRDTSCPPVGTTC